MAEQRYACWASRGAEQLCKGIGGVVGRQCRAAAPSLTRQLAQPPAQQRDAALEQRQHLVPKVKALLCLCSFVHRGRGQVGTATWVLGGWAWG